VLSLTENGDTETATGRLMFNFLGTIAEYFLDLNRTIEGLKAALARGRKGGRRRKLNPGDEAVARNAEGSNYSNSGDRKTARGQPREVLRLFS
jgi:DNA invertase Pin-like site-specific DNA recombinase